MKHTRWIILAVLLAVAAFVSGQYITNVYFEQGGSRLVVATGGSLDVESGGEIDVESGGNLKLAGTQVTSNASELNLLDGVSGLVQADLTKLAAIDATASQINKLNVDGVVVIDSTTVDASGGGSGQTTNCTNVPANSIILDVVAVVGTSFDGDTTQTLEVGVSGNTDKYIDTTEFDPAAAANTYKAMTGSSAADQTSTEWVGVSTQVIATWTNDASATAGEVTVYVVYVDLS